MKEYKISGNGKINVSKSAKIGNDVQFIFQSPGNISIGDYCSIGDGVKFICSGGDIFIDDWTTLHDNCLVLSGEYVKIAEHCWFGQNSVIDGSGGISIGRGVRVGMYSQLWSHVAAGEQIEGCTLFGRRPVDIGDDVWLVGSCIVASGVTLGKRTVALIGSNITKSFPPNAVIAGAPAQEKSNLNFYKDISLDEKWDLLKEWMQAYCADSGLMLDITDEFLHVRNEKSTDYGEVVFSKYKDGAMEMRLKSLSTVCCVEDKKYNKRFSEMEYKVLKFLSGNKARFNKLGE